MMEENWVELDGIRYRRVFPWLHLFRGLRIAVDLRKVLLAALAVALLYAGNVAFLSLPFAPAGVALADAPWNASIGYGFELAGAGTQSAPHQLLSDPWGTLVRVGTNWPLVLMPIWSLVEPASALFQPGNSWSAAAYAWTRLLWALCVWSLFAGAITRIAAVQFARGESVSTVRALKFSGRKFLSYLAAPLLPLIGIGLLWLLCLLGGLIGRIPGVGEIVLGMFWIIPLVFGMLMALALVGLAVGWPLMFPAISTEGSDAFDGFSRSYSYVFAKPWHYLWNVFVALVYGSAVIFVVWLIVTLAVYLGARSVASGMGTESTARLLRTAPETIGGSELLAPADDAPSSLGTAFSGIWLAIVSLMLIGFVHSYFWTQATIIYFLLRRSDDATDLDMVYIPESEQEDELLPLMGIEPPEESLTTVSETAEEEASVPTTATDGSPDGSTEPARDENNA